MDFTKFAEYGLSGLLIGAIIAFLFFFVKWTLLNMSKLLDQATKERETNSKERECWLRAFSEHTEAAKAFHASVVEEHRAQRAEHKEMIDALGRINGYKS